jgi:spermidine synthase
MTLLGMAYPFAIRLAMEDTNQTGKTAGRIYAISTLGSFFGTFLPVLVLIPLMGTYRTFFTIGLLLVVLGLWGLAASTSWKEAVRYAWMPILIMIMLIWGLPGTDKKSSGMVYESESAYNYIQVLEFDGFRYLRLNEGQGVHSIYHPDTVIYGGPWEQVLTAPFFNPAPQNPAEITSMAIVGLAAGTTARQASAAFPNIEIDGFEIDPEIVNVGRQWFDMNEPNLNVIVEDGRWGLKNSEKQYQIISVDAYRPPYIPAQMTTREFFEEAHAHLTDDGVLVLNVGRAPNDRRLIDALGTTLLTVFPTVHAVDVPDSFNTILFATMQPTVPDNLSANLENLKSQPDVAPVLLDALQTAAASLAEGPRAGVVFTDDHAPVEWITNDMVLRFLLFGEMEELS